MSHTTLIDWLYLDNSNNLNNSRKGGIVIIPRMIDRWNVTSVVVSNWEYYKIVIVTDYPDEFMSTITHNVDWMDLELIPFILLKYSDLLEISRALQNTEVDVIIFDDARMLAIITPAFADILRKDLSVDSPKIIVFTTWGDSLQHLDVVTSNFSELQLLKFDIISDNTNINWKISYVHMSDRQLSYYDEARQKEITEQSDHVINYPITRMLTLYAYPDQIMNDTLNHKYICETDQHTFPDKLINSTWLNSSYIDTLPDDGPKLLSILDGLIGNWPAKQIVITRFNHRYGVDLITSFLQLMSQNNKNPYELDEIFHVSCSDDYDNSLNILHKFNDSNTGILVTNIVPLIPLKGVSVIHIADSYSFMTIQTLLDRIYKRYLNNKNIDLTIYSHIAKGNKTNENSLSSDEALYEKFVNNIKEADRIYSGLIEMSTSISFDPKLGLIVK